MKFSVLRFQALALVLCAPALRMEAAIITIRPDIENEQIAATAEWLRPGDWAVSAAVVAAPVSVADVSFTTNKATAQIYSNLTETVMYSLSADLSVETLDELELMTAPGDVTFSCDDPLTGISGARFTASSPGTYRVAASSSNGVRYVDVPLVNRQSTSSNATVYVADASISNHWRKGVNDAFLSALSSATTGGVVVANGSTNGLWWTVRCPCRPISGHTVQGYRSRNALSPHLLLGARHYGYNYNTSWLTFYDPAGQTNVAANSGGLATGATAYDFVDIPEGFGFPLCMWALSNGFTRAELAAMKIEDVAIYPITSGGPLPDSCCPWFCPIASQQAHFGDGSPIGGWAFSQTYVGRTGPDGVAAGNFMTPCVVSLAEPSWQCACYTWRDTVRADILARWSVMKTAAGFPPIFGGDSSGGVYIVDGEGRWIMVSMYTTVGTGPNLSAALPVLRKLCQQYGDTLKEIE